MFRSALLITALLASGCAYKSSLTAGHRAAVDKRWDDAADHFQAAAAKRPGSWRAAESAQMARAQAAAVAMEKVFYALNTGDVGNACKAWAHAMRQGASPVALDEGKSRMADAVEQRVREAVDADDLEAGFAVLEAAEPCLGSAAPGRTLLTDHGQRDVDQALGDKRFHDAWTAAQRLDVLAPAARETAVARRWVAHLNEAAAADTEAGRVGSAYVQRTMATRLVGSADLLAARDTASDTLIDRHGFRFRLVVTGTGAATAESSVTRAARGRLADVDDRKGLPTLRIDLAKPTLAEKHWEVTGSKRYLAGTRMVPNPAWAEQLDDVAEAEERVTLAYTEAERARADLDYALQRMNADAARLASASEEQRSTAEGDLNRSESTAESERRDYDSELSDADSRAADLRREREALAGTPQMIEEEDWQDFLYEVTEWKRTCTAEAAVRWEGLPGPAPTTATGVKSMSDKSHRAHVRYGVDGDAHAWPRSDARLCEDASADRLRPLGKAATEGVDAWLDAELRAAASRPKEDRIALYALAALMGTAPPSEAAHLMAAEFDLHDMDWLWP